MEQGLNNINYATEEELTIDLRKYFYILSKRKNLIIKVFAIILAVFILQAFIGKKEYISS